MRWTFMLLVALLGCGDDSVAGGTGGGGSPNNGGSPGNGGTPNNGGSPGNGGTPDTGGAPSEGGAPGSGGSVAEGGAGGAACADNEALVATVCDAVAACRSGNGCVEELSKERCEHPDCVELFDAQLSCIAGLIANDAWTSCPDFPAECSAEATAFDECAQQ
jgi:hypothetical protein